ncbi:unnamed protein product [Vitrella brassicaformis CCMP3155]|uniref:Uncharacterized protein n=1 Tax=Vitrella brassicaformis (strain CCMP3155) TaxID=1169540 RepID=A0A0G4FCW8_VITBC|nr:unnamed protein product [Vitrella brassicaformis CCMP3155]|eukprot:CEM11016.1 unnamed protein product [Vitrella brassicaformis CCMP3155]
MTWRWHTFLTAHQAHERSMDRLESWRSTGGPRPSIRQHPSLETSLRPSSVLHSHPPGVFQERNVPHADPLPSRSASLHQAMRKTQTMWKTRQGTQHALLPVIML